MKFVALLSGGKDSCYNTIECVRHGHELVCLANLYPPASVSDEADSFMYQSAAHTALEAQAECFGKPLIRRELTGQAVNQSLQYAPTEMDEVEDMFLLLKEVKERFPEVEAVASGAILSTYQRTRVENVCERLGLTSLAFLWRRQQSPLLEEMIDSGVDAVLVKVASLGLEPSKHLGRSLAALRPFFEGLHKRYGFHVCGEGGEYETLTLDCPLFVRRLVLDETVKVVHSEDMFAPVGLLRVVKCHTEPKDREECSGSVSQAHPCPAAHVGEGDVSPGGADEQQEHACRHGVAEELKKGVVVTNNDENEGGAGKTKSHGAAGSSKRDASKDKNIAGAAIVPRDCGMERNVQVDQRRRHFLNLPNVHEASGGVVYVSGICAPDLVRRPSASPSLGGEDDMVCLASACAARQAASCLALARSALINAGVRSMKDVCFVHLYLRDMRHFAAVNAEYCKWFEGGNPPSRSCVSVRLSAGCMVMLDLVAVRGSGEVLTKQDAACAQRQVLHVRSISKWAPVCIGPYCQANTVGPRNALCLIAGQIGIIPASMVLPPRPSLDAVIKAVDKGSWAISDSAANDAGSIRRFHGAEMALCVKHASAVASALGASLSRGCIFATIYVSQETAIAAACGARTGWTAAQTTTAMESRNTIDAEEGVERLRAPKAVKNVTISTASDATCDMNAENRRGNGRVGNSNGQDTFDGDSRGIRSTVAGKIARDGTSEPDGDWLDDLVEECRALIREGFADEQREAMAAAAGAGNTIGGDDCAEDSAEEGWTSDPEELAKEAARKRIVERRLPLLPVVVPSLPKNAAVELEVICMSRAALSLLSCKSYEASTRREVLFPSPMSASAGCPVPLHLLPPQMIPDRTRSLAEDIHSRVSEAGKEGVSMSWKAEDIPHGDIEIPGNSARDEGNGDSNETKDVSGKLVSGDGICCAVASVTTSGSSVDRILCVVQSSLIVGVVEASATSPGSQGEGLVDEIKYRHVSRSEIGDEDRCETGASLSAVQLERALTMVLSQGVSAAISAARLHWRDVSSLRVYFVRRVGPGRHRERCEDEEDGHQEEELIKRALFLALAATTPERPAITFVPVDALAGEAHVCVDATAWSIERLNTEMWVRGAS